MCLRLGPDIQWAFSQGIEAANVVQAHDVIGVRVRQHQGVDHVDAIGDALEAKLRGGVDQNCRAALRDDRRGACALVVRVGAGADFAVAADHRDAGAGAGAEEQKLDLGHCSNPLNRTCGAVIGNGMVADNGTVRRSAPLLLKLWIAYGALCSCSGWVLSRLHQLNPAGYAATAAIGAISVAMFCRRRKFRPPRRRFLHPLSAIYLADWPVERLSGEQRMRRIITTC